MILSAHQPNFFPYLGFFYKIAKSDVFVLLDHVQYSKGDYQSKNNVRINDQKVGFHVPIKYRFPCPTNEIEIDNSQNWKKKILNTFLFNYKKAKHYSEGIEFLKDILCTDYKYLWEFNTEAIIEISERIGIDTKFKLSSTMPIVGKNVDMLIEICKLSGADQYLSGLGAIDYNDPEKYANAGIKLIYTDYEPQRYEQIGEGFIENLSVLDWIFNMGFVMPDGWK